MSILKNLIAGFGGAVALNILHESLKNRGAEMPRIDKLGAEALQKGLGLIGSHINSDKNLYRATLGADLVSNAMYYSMIGVGKSKKLWPRAIFLGATAGIGALTLPKDMGLDDTPVTKTNKTKALTVGYYLLGALVTGCIIKMIKDK